MIYHSATINALGKSKDQGSNASRDWQLEFTATGCKSIDEKSERRWSRIILWVSFANLISSYRRKVCFPLLNKS